MGLDMYLNRKTYVKNWAHHQEDERHEVTVKRGGQVREDIKPSRVTYITEEVAYWRKANAIHRWFVETCQNGEDDCREAYVTIAQVRDLVTVCKQVLSTVETVDGVINNGTTHYPDGTVVQNELPGQVVAQKAIAEKLLPSRGGFFFGNTDYDEYYLSDLKRTVELLEPLLAEDSDGSLYYHSSW